MKIAKIKMIVLAVIFELFAESAPAGQGWYILKPLIKNEKAVHPEAMLDLKAPLNKWEQATILYRTAYDTAKECDAALKGAYDRADSDYKWSAQSLLDFLREKKGTKLTSWDQEYIKIKQDQQSYTYGQRAIWAYALCIASDDPRLK